MNFIETVCNNFPCNLANNSLMHCFQYDSQISLTVTMQMVSCVTASMALEYLICCNTSGKATQSCENTCVVTFAIKSTNTDVIPWCSG